MQILIEDIVRKLHDLPEAKLVEVLDFVEFLTWHRKHSTSKQGEVEDDKSLQTEDEEFEVLADRLANEYEAYVESNVPVLSDYAISRAGIYEEHP